MNKFGNIQKMITLSSSNWSLAQQFELINIVADYDGERLVDANGHKFHNMVSCSYLNLDTHPKVLNTTKEFIQNYGRTNINTPRLRIKSKLLSEVERDLSTYFSAKAILGSTCSAISEGILPLVAAGIFTNNIRPKMIFDRFAHFSMNIIKAICGDETEVVTCNHNDLEFIENECKTNNWVAYICDGAYSTGGVAPVNELKKLQEKYNLFIYYDDSHSLSACGKNGYGVVHSNLSEVDDKTILVYSLAKAFGAGAGGMALLGNNIDIYEKVQRYAGPLAWSQPISTAVLGSVAGSLSVHRSPEFYDIQQQLVARIKYFDENVMTNEKGNITPLRFVWVGESIDALEMAKNIYKQGYYVSPVFFPIVPKGQAALRIMINTSISHDELKRFCQVINVEIAKIK